MAIFFVNGFLHAQVTANFQAFPTSGCSPLVVQFSDLSTGNPNSWSWNFGNGNTSSLQNPTIVYSVPGTYTVTLTSSSPGNSDTETKTAYITVYGPPNVQFSAQPTLGCLPMNVQFTDLSTSGAPITSHIWNFGDGNVSTQQNATNLYNSGGFFNVSLFITDANGCTGSRLEPGMVQATPPPQAGFSTPDTLACTAPFTVNFSNTTTGGLNNSYEWDFGDGNTSTATNPVHTYLAPGTYSVRLTVDNAAGCRDTLLRGNLVRIASPAAGFSASPTRLCVGDPVVFQDQSTGGATSYLWDFGDGNQSTLPSPTYTYAAPGTYSVTQVVQGSGTCADTLVQSNLIEVVAPPVANFGATNVISCQVPFNVTFSDSSQGAVAWFWDFGDGGTSSLQNPSHTYSSAGQFDVTLVVLNADSCRDTLVRPAYIAVVPPVASFTYNIIQSGCMPRTVAFTNTSTTSLGNIVAYAWDFGDGSTSANPNPNHTYNTPGLWTVTLIVTTSGGCRDTLIVPGFIGTGPDPVANFTATPLTMCYGDTVQFTNTSTNATNFTWDFGDTYTSNSVNPGYVYRLPGCYDVTLIADTYNCPDTITRTNYVCVQGVRADFTWNPAFSCDTPATVTFTSLPSGPNLKWSWNLGDGNTATGPTVTHTYNQAGAYLVTMFVEDTLTSCSDSVTHTFLVSRPAAGFTVDTTAGCVPFTVNFTDTTSSAASWSWDFGDGNSDTLPNPSHQYTTQGNYDIRLIAAYANGCADTAFFPALITAHDLTANFSVNSTVVCAGQASIFNDLSNGTSPISTWAWTFGDGGTSGVQDPQHSYTGAGTYNVGLAVVDANGCTDTLIQPNLVQVSDPQAAFNLSDSILCPGEILQLSNLSTGSIQVSNWDFGDGNVSSLTSPSHTYATNGNYTVSLVVRDSAGCSDSTFQVMQVSQPVAAFSVSDSTRNCPPLVVNFTNNSTGNFSTSLWNFGDGTSSQLPNPSYAYTTPGNFTVTLVVSTPTGCADTLEIPGRVDLSGPSALISLDRDTICAGDTVTLSAFQVDGSFLTWIFDDGNVAFNDSVVQHSYQTNGTYFPSLVLQDSLGCTVILHLQDSILVMPSPVPAFQASPTVLCDPGTVDFTDQTQFSTAASTWNWNFGDGGSSSQSNPSHFYSAPGSYGVTLQVSDSLGCSASLAMPALISVREQIASFLADTTSGCIPLAVNFTDTSFADTTITTWQWTFGDGNSGVGPVGTHTYIDTGYYDVTLVITTAVGCTDTLTLPGLVYGYLPANVNPPDMIAATVVNDAEIGLQWAISPFRGAGEIVLERSTDGISWGSVARLQPGTSQYQDANVDVHASSYYYQLSQEDSCGGISPLSRTARSILLQIDDQDGTGRLSWNPYSDWAGGVDRYEVEARDVDGGTWQNLATLPGGQNSFRDLYLSDAGTGRCYRVTAHETNGNLALSLSNEACGSSELWVPNTITPNGDGANDMLVIPALAGFPGSSISIYNRWGGLVYESADYQNDWAGVHQATGEPLPDGTYFYLLRIADRDQVLKGYTTIMR